MNFSGISQANVAGKLLRLPLKLVPNGLRVPILQGRLKGKTWLTGASTHGCWLGSYEFDKQQLFEKEIPPGAVVFDIGANVGFYTLLASVLVGPQGRVVAFEPVPRNLRFIKRHIRLNRLTNVSIVEAAVSETEGKTFFNNGTNNSMGFMDSTGDFQVRTVGLDELLEAGQIPIPQYLKIDVEGAEGHVLLGAQKLIAQHHPTIFLATHGAEVNRQCCDLLSVAGYDLRPLDGRNLEESDEILAEPKV